MRQGLLVMCLFLAGCVTTGSANTTPGLTMASAMGEWLKGYGDRRDQILQRRLIRAQTSYYRQATRNARKRQRTGSSTTNCTFTQQPCILNSVFCRKDVKMTCK